MFKKTIYFRIWSTIMTLVAGRLWFGDWHMTKFSLFLIFYCSLLYWVFEKVWKQEAQNEDND